MIDETVLREELVAALLQDIEKTYGPAGNDAAREARRREAEETFDPIIKRVIERSGGR